MEQDDKARPRASTVFALAVAVPVLGWLGWLNWHDNDDPWQVVGLAVCIGAVAAIGGWMGRARLTALTLMAATVVMFGIDGSTEEFEDANMWPAGAFLLVVVALPALLVVAYGAWHARLLSSRWRERQAG